MPSSIVKPRLTRLSRNVHERLPSVDVVLSSDVFPEIREYERASTTVAEACTANGGILYGVCPGALCAATRSIGRIR